MKKFIRLFQNNERSNLEENLNRFINQYDDVEIRTWTDNGLWRAEVRYSFPTAPTYCKPEVDCENQ